MDNSTTASKMAILFSIIVPTYNRLHCLPNAIQSAQKFIATASVPAEIIVIDDASTDGTRQYLETQNDIISIFLPQNQGVTKARMAGAKIAKGKWFILLDSDDELIPESAQKFLSYLSDFSEASTIYFNCISKSTGQIVGGDKPPQWFTVRSYLYPGPGGDRIPVYRRDVMLQKGYDPRISAFEGLFNLRAIREFGPAYVAGYPILINNDYPSNQRLSSFRQRLNRARDMAFGNYLLLKEFWHHMRWQDILSTFIRMLAYAILSLMPKQIDKPNG